MLGIYANMATYRGQDVKGVSVSDVDLLLHPELLSQDYMQLILREKNLRTSGGDSRDHLTELYLRHVMPLPQRNLPNNRWGKRMIKTRESSHKPAGNRLDSNDHNRKRPLIVFDGSSSHSDPVKLKKPGRTDMSTVVTDRLKPPPAAANLSNPIRRLSGTTTTSSSTTQCSNNTSLKREANSTDVAHSSEVKKKIQHVTWP